MANIFGSKLDVLPEELGSIKPGSQWCWEPLKMDQRCYIEVVAVEKKAGGNWWVLCRRLRMTPSDPEVRVAWNELSRFIEAAVLTKAG